MEKAGYAIAIDIGTTNIEIALVDMAAGDIMSTTLQPNVNRNFGRDVMTRITQAERGNLQRMSTELRMQLSEMIEDMISEAAVDITKIVIACNTTMTHILMEEDCYNLGVFPFKPVHTEQTDIMSTDINILPDRDPVPVTILPGFSAYVGGDIVSGVLSLDLLNRPGKTLLIDLGTNGEMVYHNADTGRTLVTSAAAGPAFELAGRSKATEIIEGIAALRQQDIIDETGLLTDEYFETGYRYKEVNITQSLIRDVQTAKSAIRTGIEILTDKAGSVPDRVFISGAFGKNLDTDAAIAIGMLPGSFADRTGSCGNTSLAGAARYCIVPEQIAVPECEEIYLADEGSFNDLYIEHMNL